MRSYKKFEPKKYNGSNDICTTCKEKLIEGQKYIEIEQNITIGDKILYKKGKYHFLCLAKRKYFIAFLDILGFFQLTQNSTLDELYETIQNMFLAARASKVEGNIRINTQNNPIILSNIPYIAISDSIIIYQEVIPYPDTEDEFELKERAFGEFILGLEELFKEAFKRKIHLRGGIGYGDAILSLNTENQENIILGRPYVDSIEIEKAQSWMGLAFHPSMSEYLERTRYRSMLVKYEVPIKKAYRRLDIPNITIGWVDSSNAKDIEKFKEWEIYNKRQKKIKENTLEFFSFCKDRDSRLISIDLNLNSL